MSLHGWTLPQSATGRAATLPPPPWHYSGDVIAVDFRTDPARIAELAPPDFVPTGDGACTFFFCEWASAAECDPRIQADPAKGQYREAYVVFVGTFRDAPAGRVPYIWVDSELSLVRGLVQGFPKKLGAVHMTRPVELGASEFEELDLLAPREVGAGWVYATAFSVTGGRSLPIAGAT